VFSPDGTKLAFQRASGAAEGEVIGRRIWIKSIAGGSPVPLSVDTTTYFHDAATWSPDGEWLAYLSGQDPINITLRKTQVGGRAAPVTLLSGIPPFVARPQWSPDGQWILCETLEGLTMVAPDGTRPRVIAEPGWFAYAWDRDNRRIFGLRVTEDEHHIMLVSVDVVTGNQRVINDNLGAIPQALQPIRGFSRLRDGGFLTSIARVRSDIYLIEGLQLPRPWWQRWWPSPSSPGR
jgi:dipeptidyl aminopeptidase/acylaminoacyl peptidase